MDMKSDAASEEAIANEFVRARLRALPLKKFPGKLPIDLESAYRIQDFAIRLWPTRIAGWKTSGRLLPYRERIIGPAFDGLVRSCNSGQVIEAPVLSGGVTVIEPEVIVRVATDPPSRQTDWTISEAAKFVGEMCIGAEIASSPLESLIPLGATSIASDFGCNFGIVVGEPIDNWQTIGEIKWKIFIDDKLENEVTRYIDSALAAFAFALGRCAGRGHPLKEGMVIATGAHTDIEQPNLPPPDPDGRNYKLKNHELGQTVRAEFDGVGSVACRLVAARPIAAK